MRVFLCSSMLLMFTLFQAAFAQETITVQPDDKVVTNETSATRVKGGPLEKDLVKTVDLSENTLFSIKLNATNFDRYIRITSYSTNLDFVRFTRDKTNAFLTFRTLTAGIGKLDFQVDNEENIIRKYFYTINVTNSQGIAAMETNAVLEPDNETNDMMSTNTTMTNTVSTNTAMTNEISTNTVSTNTAMTNEVSTNTTMTNEANNQNNTASTNQQSSVIKKPSVMKENTQAKAPVESNPETIALFKSAEDLKNIKDYNNAVNTYSNVISQYPKSKYSVYSYFRIGDIYNQNKDYNNAFDMYKQASSLENANNN